MMEETTRKLRDLKLVYMAQKLEEMSRSPQYGKLDKDELLACVVDYEYENRRENRVGRFLREAHIRFPSASLEDLDYAPARNLKKTMIRELASLRYMNNHQNILISGPTGSGKTFVASALGTHACRNLKRCRYWRLSRLLEEIRVEKSTGEYLKMLERISRFNLLILDDLGPDILTRQEKTVLMEVVEERYMTGSILVASQLPFEQWYEVFGDATTSDAICDRLFHNAIKIELSGDSLRKK